ncbi:MAG TPA: FtsQ-type POTRA domain-containing protein [Caldilineaceae bacterium]|nr:FtsQ-type POTRA domain-containing protein [Caldilineaceae bacterium]
MRRTTAPRSSKTGQRKAQTARRGREANKNQDATGVAELRKPQPSLVLPTPQRVNASQQQAQQQARRRRRTARQVRRFESVVAHVPGAALADYDWRARVGQMKWRPSHLLSLCLFVLAFGGIGWVHYDEQWYVYREYVTFHNTTHQTADELYELIEVDGWNIFWLSASAIRDRLVALPTIADAQVQITPPHWITIDITETEPVALWITQDGDFWLLPDGTALARTDERYDQLPRIIDHLREASALGDMQQQEIDPDVLSSALALLQRVPAIENLYYNAGYGLNFHMPGSTTWVYWGDGNNADQKYQNLLTIAQDLRTQQQAAEIVDVRFEKPVIK